MKYSLSSLQLSGVRRQRGAVLFIALVMLVLITLLAVTAIGSSILQERMVGGLRNQQLGTMGSESALRGTESWLWNLSFTWSEELDEDGNPVLDEEGNPKRKGHPLTPCLSSSTGMCVHHPNPDGTPKAEVQAFRTSKSWKNPPAGSPVYAHTLTGLTGDLETASLSRQPVVIIEDVGPNVPPGTGRQSGAIDPENLTASRFYRITARSEGGNGAIVRVMESVFSSANLTDTGTEP